MDTFELGTRFPHLVSESKDTEEEESTLVQGMESDHPAQGWNEGRKCICDVHDLSAVLQRVSLSYAIGLH